MKKAIVESLKIDYKVNWFDEDGSEYPIRVSFTRMRQLLPLTVQVSRCTSEVIESIQLRRLFQRH